MHQIDLLSNFQASIQEDGLQDEQECLNLVQQIAQSSPTAFGFQMQSACVTKCVANYFDDEDAKSAQNCSSAL